MIRYYPKNRIKSNQYTSGGEYRKNGADYAGYYYTTYDGRVFTGKDPYDIDANIPLDKLVSQTMVSQINEDTSINKTLNVQAPFDPSYVFALDQQTGVTPQQYYPEPTPEDYQKGFFIRYFAKKRNESTGIIEISKASFDNYQINSNLLAYSIYQTVDVFWKLTGPLRDDRVGKKYPEAGIIDTNERIVTSKDQVFKGLKAYIAGNYTKFSRTS
jgi:hypothetical protein